jgi:hypothetical protein
MTDSPRAHEKADQLLVDAMLRGQQLDTSNSLEDRLERIQRSIARESEVLDSAVAPLVTPVSGRNWNAVIRAALGGATAIAAVLMVVVLLQTSPVSATDLLERAHQIETSSAIGDHRYEVTIRPSHQHGNMPVLKGVLDVRDGKQMRFDLTQPNGTHHIWGFGVDGPWQLRPNGRVIRDRAARWPRWLMGESRSLLIDTMPGLLDLVLTGYDAFSSHSEDGITTIIATQRDAAEGGPDEIVIELDPGENQVSALELRWNPDSEEQWRRKHEVSGRSGSDAQRRRRGDPAEGDRMHRPGEFEGGPPPPPRGRGMDSRMHPRHPPLGREGTREVSVDQPARIVNDRNAKSLDRHAAMREKFRRPGGPPAPSAIRFERIAVENVPLNWYSGPESNRTETDYK